MNEIKHQAPDALIAAYAAGSLPRPFSLVVAAQISMSLECRAAYESHLAVGGAVLEGVGTHAVSGGLKDSVLALLDAPEEPAPAPEAKPSGVYPAPIMEALKGAEPRWKPMGMGVRQCIIDDGPEGSARLLFIPPGQAVPDHGHGGLELTLVLQGSFSDETGKFGVGDMEVADDNLEHTPVAGGDVACICLAATDQPLKFNSFVPRLLQPVFRI